MINLARSALVAQSTRLAAIAANVANVGTTRTPEGGPYRRREVILGASSGVAPEVVVLGVREDYLPPKLVYDPTHPDASPEGIVAYPNVDLPLEMVDLLSAMRAYEAGAMLVEYARDASEAVLFLLRA
ncbi:MAG TPA: flagellar basal body rod protein FlgC [Armatimonadetes bacterium]|nr:flagellar basal body rod protein FlgC [Armatimonadota bacterium]